jgi:hypothetical protein
MRLMGEAVGVFFRSLKKSPRERSPVKDVIKYCLEDPDFPILLRYSLYTTLDRVINFGGVGGSLTLDCVFTMFFYPLITHGTYTKLEHKSFTRPPPLGFTKKEGYEALIQDGPFKVQVHKCKGIYWKENATDWLPGGAFDRARQTDGCMQCNNGECKREKPLCTASFTLDFHYCQEFNSKSSCQGPMVRKGILSGLDVDRSKSEKDLAECRPWFVIIDSGFRAGFSSLSAIWTTWYLRNCMYVQKEKHVDQCVDTQVQKPLPGTCSAAGPGGMKEDHGVCDTKDKLTKACKTLQSIRKKKGQKPTACTNRQLRRKKILPFVPWKDGL